MTGFIWRLAAAFTLLVATFNPTEWNYVTWVQENFTEQMPLAVLLGLLLLVGYIVYLRATLRSIGAFGMFMVLAIVAATVWVFYDYGLLRLNDTAQVVWLALGRAGPGTGYRAELEPCPAPPFGPGGHGRCGRVTPGLPGCGRKRNCIDTPCSEPQGRPCKTSSS